MHSLITALIRYLSAACTGQRFQTPSLSHRFFANALEWNGLAPKPLSLRFFSSFVPSFSMHRILVASETIHGLLLSLKGFQPPASITAGLWAQGGSDTGRHRSGRTGYEWCGLHTCGQQRANGLPLSSNSGLHRTSRVSLHILLPLSIFSFYVPYPCSRKSDVFPIIWAFHLSLSFAKPLPYLDG